MKYVQCSYPDPGRGQPCKVCAARRHRICRHIFCSAFFPQIRLPAKPIALLVPRNAIAVINIGAENSPIVQHGVNKQLKNGFDLLPVMRKLNEGGCQPAPGAFTPYRNALCVYAKLLGTGYDPF